ncbi:hypothetical protein CTAYLR_008210 [Chrysophaeum taylorii]|uniref:EamA domain-containing protein n=1 Tax=Chrysophaeum taylorii TaxID=2483200 RepID=A0AAD7XJP6_9STRA|nr:hypothetical protein CTAYLR_008210 [Chrysophaeum taylorii]
MLVLLLSLGHGLAPPQDASRVLERAVSRSPYATLVGVTAIWGSQHSVIRWAVGEGDPEALTALRFSVAAACLAPFAPRDPETWRAGAELGVWSFLGFALQAVGLETTTATRSAFLLYLNVKLVPVVGLARGKRASIGVWASAACALCGTTLLTTDRVGAFVVGDAWSLAAAVASAIFIVRLEDLAKGKDSAELAAATAATTALLALLWSGPPEPTPDVLLASVYLGAFPSAACGFLQTAAQKYLSAPRAAVVYALDPLWAYFFAYILLGETLQPRAAFGATLVAIAALGPPVAAAITDPRRLQQPADDVYADETREIKNATDKGTES